MKKLFMAVIALMMTLSASAQFYIYCSDGKVIKVDSISMIAPADAEDPTNPNNPSTPSQGIGVFSVSATKQVTFSPGNLQYTQSTNTWSFAENQWDYIGTDNVTGGSVTSNPSWGDSKEGSALADKVDLFGWSTNATNFGVSTSENYSDYSGSFVDWGTNKIGNDAPNTWRALTYDEWEYLLNTRPNASSLKGVAQVNGVNGLILLPDSWTCPAGVTFKSGFHSSHGVDYYAAYQTFTAEQWSKLESAGAVFLPAAGERYGSGVEDVQYDGDYWYATENDSYSAYCFGFYSDVADWSLCERSAGLSVRLVKDVEGNSTPTPGNENGHEYVDLGLSVKWATCNVGATKPEEYGDYFAWGEVEPKDYYEWSTYKWCNGSSTSSTTFTKYNDDSSCGTVDNKTVLDKTDDAAAVNWGGSWRMPTDAELTELRENCTWTTQTGVNGYKVTSKKNGNSIFLPAAGYRYSSSLNDAGSDARYWSSSLRTGITYYAYYLIFYSGGVDLGLDFRNVGFTVRPVCQ